MPQGEAAALLSASGGGKLDVVKRLVDAGAELSVTDYRGDTCLILAARGGHTDTVGYLVGFPEVDVNHRGRACTALHYAVRKGTQMVQILIDAGADVQAIAGGHTPLMFACSDDGKEHVEVVQMLVRAGAGVSVATQHGDTCLIFAASHGHTETVRYLVGLPVDVNRAGKSGLTALHYAVRRDNQEVVQMLIDAGADVGAKDASGNTVMREAVYLHYIGNVKILVRAGAGFHVTDQNRDAYLSLAAADGCSRMVRYLLGLPEVDVNHADADGWTALHHCTSQPDPEIATTQMLLAAGADIEARNRQGCTPLLLACGRSHQYVVSIVEVLVQAGADLCARDARGDTCLILAVREGHVETVRYLMCFPELDIDAVGSSNCTALLHAVETEPVNEMVRVLVQGRHQAQNLSRNRGR